MIKVLLCSTGLRVPTAKYIKVSRKSFMETIGGDFITKKTPLISIHLVYLKNRWNQYPNITLRDGMEIKGSCFFVKIDEIKREFVSLTHYEIQQLKKIFVQK